MDLEQALLGAIVADAEDDLPRLAYADWLEEQGDVGRAEFIRTQCRLAGASPAAPDYLDLTERESELIALMERRARGLAPELPPGLRFYLSIRYGRDESFCRGFPYFVKGDWSEAPQEEDVSRLCAALERVMRTTTARGLDLAYVVPAQVAAILQAPAAAALTGLTVLAVYLTPADAEGVIRALVDLPVARNLQRLALHCGATAAGVAILEAAPFDRLIRLDAPAFLCPPADLARLTAAPWFRRLRHLRIGLGGADWVAAALPGLSRLPDLHTLELRDFQPEGAPPLAGCAFPSLARLDLSSCALGPAGVAALASASIPQLAILQLCHDGLRNGEVATLAAASWWPGVRSLDLSTNAIGDKGVTALAASPAAPGLRVLRLRNNPFGKVGLSAFTNPAFPNLTTLDLGSTLKRKATAEDVARFLAGLQLPRLKHLDLGGWPVGDAGAAVLASSPGLANLSRLALDHCGIGDAGAKPLFSSPHLRHLIELDLRDNQVATAAGALLDPANLPALAECWLSGNKLPPRLAASVKEARPCVHV